MKNNTPEKAINGLFPAVDTIRPVENAGWVPFFVNVTRDAEGMTRGQLCGLWSGANEKRFLAPPAIGERVQVTFNQLGTGTVTGYFVEAGFLGIILKADNRPDWHKKQNPNCDLYHVFGAEIAPIPAQSPAAINA